MTITLLLIALALVFVLFLLRYEPLRAENSSDEGQSGLIAVSVPALTNLIDVRNMEFLKANLPARDYRKARHERLRVLRIYVRRITHNTRVLIAAAESAQRQADPQVAESGKVLLKAALATRTRAIHALAMLYVGEILPNAVPDLSTALHTYQSAADRMQSLQSLTQ